jgi:hypothetical protein
MIEPFKRENNYFIPVANDNIDWFFNEPSIARREYNGVLMRHTLGHKGYEGWQFYVSPSDSYPVSGESEWTIDAPITGWHPVYPKANMVQQFLQSLKGQWDAQNSPFKYVEEFANAELLFSEDYPLGEYWLMPEEKYLIPVDCAEQISNFNELEFHTLNSVEETFLALQHAMSPLRDNVYGVIFTSGFNRARIRPSDFDWSNYE